MKKAIITIACVAAILTGCTSTKDAANVSWESFCAARGYALNEKSNEVINEYLDTWRGSVDEERAFEIAGVEPF